MRVSRVGLILALALLAATATTAQKKPAEVPAGKASKAPVWVDVEAEPGTGFTVTKGTFDPRGVVQWQQVGPHVYLPTRYTFEINEETKVSTAVRFPACYLDRGVIRAVVSGEGKPMNLEAFYYVSGVVLATAMPEQGKEGCIYKLDKNVAEVLRDTDGKEVLESGNLPMLAAAGVAEHPHFVMGMGERRIAKLIGSTLHQYRMPKRMAGTAHVALVGDSVVAIGGLHCYLISTDKDPVELMDPQGQKVAGTYAERLSTAGPYILAGDKSFRYCSLYRLDGSSLTPLKLPEGKVARQLFEFGGRNFITLPTTGDGYTGIDLYELQADSLAASKLLSSLKDALCNDFHRRANDLIVFGRASEDKGKTWTEAMWRVESSQNSQKQPAFKVARIAKPRNIDEQLSIPSPVTYGEHCIGPNGMLWDTVSGGSLRNSEQNWEAPGSLLVLGADGKLTVRSIPFFDFPDVDFDVNYEESTHFVSHWDEGGWYQTAKCTRSGKAKPGERAPGGVTQGVRYLKFSD
jgi:hypothetical protein